MNNHILKATASMQRLVDECLRINQSATNVLLWLASTDGRVSRLELKHVLDFFQKYGANFHQLDLDYIDSLNDGVKMHAEGSESLTIKTAKSLSMMDKIFNLDLLLAAERVCACNISASGGRLLVLAQLKANVVNVPRI